MIHQIIEQFVNLIGKLTVVYQSYKNIMYTTKDTGMIWFAFRIMHGIIGTKLYLNELNISDDQH